MTGACLMGRPTSGYCACEVEQRVQDHRHNPRSAGVLSVRVMTGVGGHSDEMFRCYQRAAGPKPCPEAVLLLVDAPHCERCPAPRKGREEFGTGRVWIRAGWWVPGDGLDDRLRRLVVGPDDRGIECLGWYSPKDVKAGAT